MGRSGGPAYTGGVSGRVRIERDGAVATVVLEHPERRNAISREMWGELRQELVELGADEQLRVLVIRGAPEGGAFSPGADLTEFPEQRGTTEKAVAYKAETHAAIEALAGIECPVVAAIDGPCSGAGLELAMAADLRLASEKSSFGLPVVRLCNTADLHDVRRLARAVGASLAAEMLLTAGTVPASRLYAVGALAWIGPSEELEGALGEVIERIAGAAPRAVRQAKRGLRMSMHLSESDEETYRDGVLQVLSGADFLEGTRAFLEKRKPEFRGE